MKEWKDMTSEEKKAATDLVEAFMKLIDAVVDELVPIVSIFEDALMDAAKAMKKAQENE